MQIILNAFRLKPLEQVLPAAREAGVGIIAPRAARERAAVGPLHAATTTFGADDHRTYNRHGEAFDVGETFSGVDFETGLEAVRRLAPLVPEGATMAQWALRWVLDQPGLSVVIPGARNAEQARRTPPRPQLPPLSADDLAAVQARLRRADPPVRARALVAQALCIIFCMFAFMASATVFSSALGLNWTYSVPASAFGTCPGGR